jgi:hypothetical protein
VLLLVLFWLPDATESCGVVRKTCSGGRVLFYLWPAAEFARVRGNSALGWAYNASTYVGMYVEWKEFLLRGLEDILLIG